MRTIVLSLVLLLVLPAVGAAKDVEVQLLGLNDFHGHLEATTPGTIAPDPASERVPAGGAEIARTRRERAVADRKDARM
jgi:2',3'-cyclic-nucleotide 2'-phosphodiesterase (5'-nucleotidase family)